MLKEIIIAIQSYYKAHFFIRKHKLWKWIIIPGIIYTLLFVVSMYFFGLTANNFIEWLSVKTGLRNWINKSNSGFIGFLFAFAGIMLWLIQMLFYFSLFSIMEAVFSLMYANTGEPTISHIYLNKEDF